MSLRTETRKPLVFEPILEKKDCEIRIVSAATHDWTPKEGTGITEQTRAMVLEIEITDIQATTENADAQVSKKIKDYINIAPHPYVSAKTGEVVKMRPNKIYQLESALGFTPYFVDEAGAEVPARITKTGKAVCPNDCFQKFNPEFIDAYFDDNDEPRYEAWLDRPIAAHIGVDQGSEEYGPKNVVKSYKAKAE